MNPPADLVVKCPRCGARGSWFAGNWGPFCSERCRLVDLGKWLNEEHRISRTLAGEDFEALDRESESGRPGSDLPEDS